jgi:hypothetical protein
MPLDEDDPHFKAKLAAKASTASQQITAQLRADENRLKGQLATVSYYDELKAAIVQRGEEPMPTWLAHATEEQKARFRAAISLGLREGCARFYWLARTVVGYNNSTWTTAKIIKLINWFTGLPSVSTGTCRAPPSSATSRKGWGVLRATCSPTFA